MEKVFEGESELGGTAGSETERFAGGREDLRAGIEGGAGANEEVDLDFGFAAHFEHFENFRVGHEHDAGALADAVDGDLARLGFIEHSTQDFGAFGGRNLNAVLAAIGEALGAGDGFVGGGEAELLD